MKKINNYWVDTNKNKWNISVVKTKEEAILHSKALINCTKCIDCYNCTNCTGCKFCNNCTNCVLCTFCGECNKCTLCVSTLKGDNFYEYYNNIPNEMTTFFVP